MFCVQCGTELPDHSKFCLECGTRVGENGEKLFKVTFDRESGPVMHSPPYRILIDQQQRETLLNGDSLVIFLTAGDHEIEISFARKIRYKETITVDKDIFIYTKWDCIWGTFDLKFLE